MKSAAPVFRSTPPCLWESLVKTDAFFLHSIRGFACTLQSDTLPLPCPQSRDRFHAVDIDVQTDVFLGGDLLL